VGRSLLILLWIGGSSLSEDTALTQFYFMKSLSGGLKPDSFTSSVTFCKAKNHCCRKVGFMFLLATAYSSLQTSVGSFIHCQCLCYLILMTLLPLLFAFIEIFFV